MVDSKSYCYFGFPYKQSCSTRFKNSAINVLNPLQAANYNSVSLGSTSIILPSAINDNNNGQNNKFVIPSSVSSGYYIVNVFTKFQDKEFNAVYTGKQYQELQLTQLLKVLVAQEQKKWVVNA